MQQHRYWLGAGLLALAGAGHAAAPSNEELQKQIVALKKAVEALQQQLDQNAQASKAAPAVPAATAVAASDAAGTPATREDLQGVQADLENFKYQVQRDRDTATATSSRALNVGGTIQARAAYSSQATSTSSSTPAGVVNNRNSSFDVPTAILAFTGNLYKDYDEGRNLGYRLSAGASQQTASNNSFLNLLDAYLTYSVLPTIDPATSRLDIAFGQQLLPFGLEVPATEDLKPVILNAQFTTRLGLAQRQIGLIARGDFDPVVDYGYNYRAPLLTYAFGVVNGNGPNTSDNNSAKDWVGRLAFTVPSDYNSWWRQLTVGGSFYRGKANLFVPGTGTLVGTGDRVRYGVDVTYNHEPFGVTYEYIQGRDDTASGTTQANTRVSSIKSDSHTATFFYNFGEQFVKGFRAQGRYDDWWPKSYQPFFRYDRFDPNTDKPSDESTVYTAGLNVFFAQTTKFQLNINHTDDKAKNQSYSDFLAQFQFGF
ncbi:hypothetical protein [Jeongeupia chitinilytica]|uniref:DUF3138 domain-containing protein n=1 Tax=Jeongeupia chitinilytica TaxID=1041641 RepID=A0ABQ3H371_9NEIS|nr:hypothetical protein [Jeongeupia chitinilytica]GHD68210.1 hypothetical protein GCM10007350_32990 [Jeongeupia chitinilytica]